MLAESGERAVPRPARARERLILALLGWIVYEVYEAGADYPSIALSLTQSEDTASQTLTNHSALALNKHI